MVEEKMTLKRELKNELREDRELFSSRINDLIHMNNILSGWSILLTIFTLGLLVLIVIDYQTSPHRICHNEIETLKIEVESIDPSHHNPYGVINKHQYPNSKIVCEGKIEESIFEDKYRATVGTICLITTTKKVCEIK